MKMRVFLGIYSAPKRTKATAKIQSPLQVSDPYIRVADILFNGAVPLNTDKFNLLRFIKQDQQ